MMTAPALHAAPTLP